MNYNLWAVTVPGDTEPQAFLIDDAVTDAEAADLWLSENGFESHSVIQQVTEITGGGGPVRPTSSGGRPVL